MTILFGAIVFIILPDAPTKAWFFTAEEKKLVVVRMAKNQTGIKTNNVCSALYFPMS